jgi:FKBP-type peptidyl-prolyl cis-trans isomerase FklB
MKYIWISAITVFLVACQGNTQNKTEARTEIKTAKDTLSYAIGMNIGKDMKKQSIDVDADFIAQGIKDMVSSGKTLITEDQLRDVMTSFQQTLMAQREVKNRELGEKNKKEGEAFLAANKTKEGVKTTASGLQYKVLKMGNGKKPKETDQVTVNYSGRLLDSTEFDNSFKRGQPMDYQVARFIKGWIEALTMMPVGSKWELYIPSDLAYGARGNGQMIPPNATLIFELELLAIK